MNQKNNQEEVDIIQLFSAIGNMFKNLFQSIGNLFKKLFYFILDFILYLKKNSIYLGAGVFIALVFSFLTQSSKSGTEYKVKAQIRTNFNAQSALENYVDLFNHWIDEKKYIELSKTLQIDTTTVKQLKSFELNPFYNDVLIIEEYENFLKQNDTVVYKFIEFDKFKKNLLKEEQLNPYWELEVNAYQPIKFDFLNTALVELIEKNEVFSKRKENYLFTLNTQKEKLLKSLQEIDSLRNVYNTVMLESAKNKTNEGVTNILFSTSRISPLEHTYNLFNERRKVLDELELLSKKLNKYSDVIVFINDFPIYGIKDNKITNNIYFNYALIGFLLVLMILLFKDFWMLLNKYQQKKENMNDRN